MATSFVVLAQHVCAQSATSDEFELFFRNVSRALEDHDRDRLKALWRKVQIGERTDRFEARLEFVSRGVSATTFLLEELSTDNLEDSRQAALALMRIGGKDVLAHLREIVGGKRKGSLRHAALVLGRLGTIDDGPALMAVASKSKSAEVVRAAIYAMGRLRCVGVVKDLNSLWERENAQETRSAIVLAAGAIGGPDARKLIFKGLSSNKESIRQAAAIALAMPTSEAHNDDLDGRLADSDETVVEHASLGLPFRVGKDITQIIERRRLLKHPSDEVRASAVTALGFQDPEVAAALLAPRLAPNVERSAVVRQSHAFALARIGGKLADTHLSGLLADADEGVIQSAACAISLMLPQSRGAGSFEALLDKRQRTAVRMTGLRLMAYSQPSKALEWIRDHAADTSEKKEFAEFAQSIARILERSDHGRSLMRAKLQVQIDDLGGSREWNLLSAVHQQWLRIEKIDRSLSGRGPGAGAVTGGEGGPPRPPDRWTKEDEDLRLWFDRFHYFDRRTELDVP